MISAGDFRNGITIEYDNNSLSVTFHVDIWLL